MKIEIKNVRHSELASEETHCFQASVYIDGKRRGTVENDGWGGPDRFNPPQLKDEIDAYAKTLPPIEADGMTLESDAEILIGDLVNEWLRVRSLKNACKGRTLYRIPDHTYKGDQWHVLKGAYTPQIKMYLLGRYGAEVNILNEQI